MQKSHSTSPEHLLPADNVCFGVYFQPMLAPPIPAPPSTKCFKCCGLNGTRNQPQTSFYQRETPRTRYPLPSHNSVRKDGHFLAWSKGSAAIRMEGGGDGRSPPPYSCQWWGCSNSTLPTGQALLYLISPHCVFSVLPSSGHIPCSFIQANQAGFQTAHRKGAIE